MIYMLFFLVIMMLAAGVGIIFIKNVLNAVIVSSVISLGISIIFVFLAAPDVAITEATIGSALTTVIFIIAISKTKGKYSEKKE
ncbi:MAG: hypothetical protein DRP84_00730 [Spirochaetes bacterium]|nr:MAG: hypothetical protein DRP84_00730 [Spirochaetota bacterium]